MNMRVRILGFCLTMIVILVVAYAGISSLVVSALLKDVEGYEVWDERVVSEMQTLPVQDGGRVKPFQTLARRYMYGMHGDRTMKVSIGGEKTKLSPTEWLMDVIFRPELADDLPTFRVDNSAILEQLGMDVNSLRDRYSYNQIRPYLRKLQKEYESILAKIKRLGDDSLTPRQQQTIAFVRLLQSYHSLKNPFILSAEVKKATGYGSMKDFFVTGSTLEERLLNTGGDKMSIIGILDSKIVADAILLSDISSLGEVSKLLLNPTSGKREWQSIGERFAKVAKPNQAAYRLYAEQVAELKQKHGELGANTIEAFYADYLEVFQAYMKRQKSYPDGLMEELVELEKLQAPYTGGSSDEQLRAISSFKAAYESEVDFGDVGGDIKAEVYLNKLDYFNNGIAILLLAGVFLIAMCLCVGTKASRVLYWCVYGLTAAACLFTIAGIVHRSVIMGRPPIGTLYDTMPFIAGAGLLLLVLVELIHRKAILLGVSVCFGVAILFLAKRYEVSEAKDQMDPLVAVLKSNYWLATHVVMITLGYMGGIVAACISHFYIIGRAFGVIVDKNDRKYLTKIVYGMVAFTLLFSLIGTILGGVWAADSWGRFWGWDPKENGALLIVIWMLVILHARLGGYIREIGLHVCSVFGFAIIVFSWWHVNFLGVGLHNYGFTSSAAMTNIWMFYGMEFLIMLIGGGMAWVIHERKAAEKMRKKLEAENGGDSEVEVVEN